MQGHSHPITILTDEITRIFTEIGFDVADGPELENEWNNFDALNVPRDHPSRDMQDTFFIRDYTNKAQTNAEQTQINAEGIQRNAIDKLGRPMSFVLRTHTSSVQIREMEKWAKLSDKEKKKNPLAIVVPGKVFRNEATDATHEAQFHQVEGLLVGENVTLAQMKGTLQHFFTKFFGKEINVRLRSSFFPFVEPGCEFDVECFKCEGKGIHEVSSERFIACSLCKGTGWIEIGGAGMVHPRVLENCGIDNRKYQGFAFGCGMDRIAMLKWGMDDVRLLYNGDLRVVNQF